VDFGPGEIGYSTAVIEVHVCQNDIPGVLGSVSKLLHTIDGYFVRVERHCGDDTEQLRHPSWPKVLIASEAGVYQNRSLIGIDQQTGHASFQFARPAGIASETVEQVNGHAITIALKQRAGLGPAQND
jgi:hypothetical protein